MTGVTGGYTVASCHSADAHSAAMCTIRPAAAGCAQFRSLLRSVPRVEWHELCPRELWLQDSRAVGGLGPRVQSDWPSRA